MRQRKQNTKPDGFLALHLLTGSCLCGCQACAGPRGIAIGKGYDEFELNESGRELWRRHRNTLLKTWRDDEATPGARGGFSAESLLGYGQYLPAWAECVYDGARLPRKSAAWPSKVKEMHITINDNLKSRG